MYTNASEADIRSFEPRVSWGNMDWGGSWAGCWVPYTDENPGYQCTIGYWWPQWIKDEFPHWFERDENHRENSWVAWWPTFQAGGPFKRGPPPYQQAFDVPEEPEIPEPEFLWIPDPTRIALSLPSQVAGNRNIPGLLSKEALNRSDSLTPFRGALFIELTPFRGALFSKGNLWFFILRSSNAAWT